MTPLPTTRHGATWQVARMAAQGKSPDSIGSSAANAAGTTHTVGTRPADALGLFDLIGNAAE